MSLINDALKKAQKQRTADVPSPVPLPSVGGEPAARIAKRAKPVGFNALLVRIGLIAGSVLVLVVGGLLALRYFGQPVAPATTGPSREGETAMLAPGAPGKSPADTGHAEAPVTFKLPVAAAPTIESPPPVIPAPASISSEPKPTSGVAATPVVSPPAAPAPVDVAPQMTSKQIAYIENLRIAGIRASGADSKVLMNDRVYRMGDFVEHDLGLKLVTITASSLEFENERGARYIRDF